MTKPKILPITPESKFDESHGIVIPAGHMPNFRAEIAKQRGVQKKMLFKTWGGLGDQICAEPTLRFALKTYTDCEVSLAGDKPDLFTHLKFHKVFNTNEVIPNWKKYFILETITPPDDTNLVWLFFSHLLTNCVDFPSLCALRSQLPVQDREIFIVPPHPEESIESMQGAVLIHAGRHWASKTFPKDWWDGVLKGLVDNKITPILIGADTDDNRGTVDVNTDGCVDLRNKLSILESIWLCQQAKVVLTNDSSPLHMAASRNPEDPSSGKAWIGFVATCKHPDFITHWRRRPDGQIVWQWREENLGLGGMWETGNYNPNIDKKIEVGECEESVLRAWLPAPESVVKWTMEKINDED